MLKNNPLIGAHTSTAGGLDQALWEGKKIGATTVQLFTSNQKQWKARELTSEIKDKWKKAVEETQLSSLMSHGSYLINLAGPRQEILEKSKQAFQKEIERCLELEISYLNFHPGACLTAERSKCLDQLVDNLLSMEPYLQKGSLRLLLETTAGQGSTIGSCFEELGYIIEKTKNSIPIGVCIDTCHVFVGGYDVRTPQSLEKTLTLFDQLVGLPHLYAFHFNDSLKGLASHIDRHHSLGEGMIGWECFEFLMKDKRTKDLPKYLETPGSTSAWTKEIQQLKNFF